MKMSYNETGDNPCKIVTRFMFLVDNDVWQTPCLIKGKEFHALIVCMENYF